jgi:hypothetical protein
LAALAVRIFAAGGFDISREFFDKNGPQDRGSGGIRPMWREGGANLLAITEAEFAAMDFEPLGLHFIDRIGSIDRAAHGVIADKSSHNSISDEEFEEGLATKTLPDILCSSSGLRAMAAQSRMF